MGIFGEHFDLGAWQSAVNPQTWGMKHNSGDSEGKSTFAQSVLRVMIALQTRPQRRANVEELQYLAARAYYNYGQKEQATKRRTDLIRKRLIPEEIEAYRTASSARRREIFEAATLIDDSKEKKHQAAAMRDDLASFASAHAFSPERVDLLDRLAILPTFDTFVQNNALANSL